jgi:pimeloyl-ACP methyl ester carboxylesterase
MTKVLGYSTYFAAGGDMGTMVTKSLAVQYPESVKAIHLTDVGYPNGTEDWSTMTPEEQAFGQQIQHWFFTEGAFNMIQELQPREGSLTELSVIGCNVDEALSRTEKFLDEALMSELRSVRLIHGYGTGQLRRAIAQFLHDHKLVENFASAPPEQGGGGVTVVELKE